MFTIPDKLEGQNDIQSILFQEDIEILIAGIDGKDCVLSGGAVTAQGSPDMTVAVAKAAVLSNGIMYPVAAANATITAADATNPRIDFVVITSAGAIAVRAGTAAAAPKPPTRTANDVVLAQIYVPATDTTIVSAQIVDRRMERKQGPITIFKDTTSVATNTTAAAVTVFTLVIPNGLFLTGKVIRVRCGGNFLHNSGTPTLTLTISYGGTTIYAGTSIATTNDADRMPWLSMFDLVSQANADQFLVGHMSFQTGLSTPPATGIGALTGAGGPITPAISGASAVDSDAADRTLLVTLTMSVSNVANEIVKEYGIATIE